MGENEPSETSVTPVRINVLLLVGAGYATLAAFFVILAWNGANLEEACDVTKGPLMALIGGSLAISKDLIPTSDDSPATGQRVDEGGDSEADQRNTKFDAVERKEEDLGRV